MIKSEIRKFKYPSFRIDDILNNNFGSNLGNNLVLIEPKIDLPINLSLRKCSDQSVNNNSIFIDDDDFYQQKPEISISPKSSYSPNSSINSLNESSDFDKYPFTNINEKNIKHNFNNYFKSNDTNDMSSTLIYPDNCINDFTCQYQSNFLMNENRQKLGKKDLIYESPYITNKMSDELNSDAKSYSEKIKNNQILSILNDEKYQNDQVSIANEQIYTQKINNQNSNYYIQQLYIRMKMLMQSKPRKGGQIRFNNSQTKELETLFNEKRYLIPSDRKIIAKRLSLSERQVKTWFQNRRAKWRKIKDNQ